MSFNDRMKQFNKQPILNTTGQTALHKKVVEIHQSNEYQAINRHLEAMCFCCFGKDTAFARNIHICRRCLAKKGRETILVTIKVDPYALCYNCGTYQFDVPYINVRTCYSCARKIAKIISDWHKNGGLFGVDPFWQKVRKDFGKDYALLMNPLYKRTGALKK